jgi:hypothetical protein
MKMEEKKEEMRSAVATDVGFERQPTGYFGELRKTWCWHRMHASSGREAMIQSTRRSTVDYGRGVVVQGPFGGREGGGREIKKK